MQYLRLTQELKLKIEISSVFGFIMVLIKVLNKRDLMFKYTKVIGADLKKHGFLLYSFYLTL